MRFPSNCRLPSGLRTVQALRQASQIVLHDAHVVLAGADLGVRQSLNRVEDGRSRAGLARDRARDTRADQRLVVHHTYVVPSYLPENLADLQRSRLRLRLQPADRDLPQPVASRKMAERGM